MARFVSAGSAEDLRRSFTRSLQSGHINFLIGSGASLPAIPAAGNIEEEIRTLLRNGDPAANARMSAFLGSVQGPTNELIAGIDSPNLAATLANYKQFIEAVEAVLVRRRSTLLPRQVTVFSTNYDLFVESVAADYPALNLNDGFARVRGLAPRLEFSSDSFFRTTYSTGNFYGYKAEVPSVNLIKLHGSLSWKREGEKIILDVSRKALPDPAAGALIAEEFVRSFSVVLPRAEKFQTTLMDRTYYDLLRIYANELDRENALLIVFGFSFADEHIRDITTRALRNPTLRVLIAAYNTAARDSFAALFENHNNVEIIEPSGANLGFETFNSILRSVLAPASSPAAA